MVVWLTEKVGTASRHEVSSSSEDFTVIDVSDLVETGGNDPAILKERLWEGIACLLRNRPVIVVCDKGIVRSSMFAMSLLVERGVTTEEALAKVVEKVGTQAINLDLIQDLKNATRKKRILVTGETGFIGSNLIPVLSQHYQVVSFPRAGLNLVDGPFELHKVVEKHGIDLIIHLAHPRARNLLPSMAEAVLMMRNILEVCRVKRLPLIYLSGLNVFSHKTYDRKFSDDLPVQCGDKIVFLIDREHLSSDDMRIPEGVYGQTKYLCETLAEAYWFAHDVKTTILRPSYVYGKDMDEDSVVCKFIQKAKRNEPIVLHKYNNGYQVLDFLHVNDLIRAIMLAIDLPGIGPLNIGTGIGTSIADLAATILGLTSSSSNLEIVPIRSAAPWRVVNPAEADRALNWKSRIALKDGLKELL